MATQKAYEWLNHSVAPTRLDRHDFRVSIGSDTLRPCDVSIFNNSAMSFDALSANAILTLNAGAAASTQGNECRPNCC